MIHGEIAARQIYPRRYELSGQNSSLAVVVRGRRADRGAGFLLCHQRNRLDEKIGRYQSSLRSINDQMAEDGARLMIAELVAQKAGLHPPPPVVEHFASRIGNVGVISPSLRRAARVTRHY